MRRVLLLILMISLSPRAHSDIINIPADYNQIQLGIDASNNGDTVLVQPGAYQELLNFNGKNIKLGSLYFTTNDTSYISSTIIDGGQNGRVVTFENGEDTTAVICGFTITNGVGDFGGAIGCRLESNPVIRNNIMLLNTSPFGGAIALNTDARIINNTLKRNSSAQGGGAIYLFNSEAYISQNLMDSNSSNLGGGISCMQSDATIENNDITNNNASGNGGGIFMDNSSPAITGNYIANNISGANGGGISGITSSQPSITDNVIHNNTAELYGGGIYCYNNSSAYVFNNTVDSNRTLQVDGGGIWCGRGSDLQIIENTVAYNSGNLYGGGIATICSPTIRDNIIEYNENVNNGGGGMYCGHVIGFPIIEGNIFRGNICRNSAEGGGIFCKSNSNPFIYNNEIYDNQTNTFGGGIYITENSLPTIVFNRVYNNTSMDGGGVYDNSTSFRLLNNLIYDNSASRDGGGIRLFASDGLMVNNVIYGNSAEERGGGIYSRSSDSKIKNCIIYENVSTDGLQLVLHESDDSAVYNNVQGGYQGIGNIDQEPYFRDPDNADFHLMAIYCGDPYDSPCIDMGAPHIIDTLLDCSMGLGSERSDMGAYGGGETTQTFIPDYSDKPVDGFHLMQNYPNPFNSSTNIRYQIPGKSEVRIDIFNISGQHIENLFAGPQDAGIYSINWDASSYASGVYYYSISADGIVNSRSMVLLK
ncbi:MAG: T9SS type A sorting domain-containing protein [candidate division Zixibacteria bacterium]|nr:T9SS type A sorting domain-containing protein [candidate division Zixibacteria bacterium]